MQQNHAAEPPKVSDSGQGDSLSAFLHNSKLRNKLKKLVGWRIDPALIEFPEDASEFRGGFATVSRAILAPSPSAGEVGNEFAHTADEHLDPDASNLQPRSDTQERKDDQQGEYEESDRRTTDEDKGHGEEDKGKGFDTHEKRINSPTSTPKAYDGPESLGHSTGEDPESGDRNALTQRDIQGHGDNDQDKDAGTDNRALDGDDAQANSEEGREGSDHHQKQQSHLPTEISPIGAETLSFEHAADKHSDCPTNLYPQSQNATQGPGDDEQGKDEESSSRVADMRNEQAKEEQKSETPQHKQVVAVKKMKIEGDMNFERVLGLALRESEFLVELSHPNVVKLEGFVEDLSAQKVWLIFLWEEHGNLRDFLASGEWEIPERISLFYDVTMGLDYLHSREPPIYHGDLKSLNILVDSECNALLTDFGSARHLPDDNVGKQPKESGPKPRPTADTTSSEEHITLEAFFSATASTLTLSGSSYTIRWAAPELLQDEKPCLRSDIWALGWIAYEVMTNTIPFHDVKKDAIVIKRVIQGHLPSVTEDARMSLVRGLCSLMVQCWTIDPHKRPSAGECKKSISWMPMIAPAPTGTTDEVASLLRRARLINQLGKMYIQQSDFFSASSCFGEALEIYTDHNHHIGRADTLCLLAQAHRSRSENAKAIKLYLEALQIYTDRGGQRQRGYALWGLATAYRLEQQYDEAFKLYSETLQIYTHLVSKRERASALWGLGEVLRLRSEYSEARNLFSEAVAIFTDVGDSREKALALWSLAQVHRAQNQYSDAMNLFSEALQIYTDVGDRRETALALQGLADAHHFQQDYPKAIALYSEALQIISEVGDQREKGCILSGLAKVHQSQGNFLQAIALLSEALQVWSEVGDPREKAITLWYLAELHRSQQEYSTAHKLYSESLQIYTDIGDRQFRGNALWGLAEVHRALHEYNKATELYSEALQIFTDFADRFWRAETLLVLGVTNEQQGHFSEAISLFTDASEVLEEMGDSRQASRALEIVADLRKALEDNAADLQR